MEGETPRLAAVEPHYENTMKATVVARLLDKADPSSVGRPPGAVAGRPDMAAVAPIRVNRIDPDWAARHVLARPIERNAACGLTAN